MGFTLPAAGRRVRRTISWTPGSWASRQPRDRRMGRASTSRSRSAQRIRGRRRGAPLGEVHEGRDEGRQARRFTTPKGIVAIDVCRLSGKLPNAGCHAVDVVDDAGSVETRSMIYTEYFLRGTEPTELCPLHGGVSIVGHLATLFGKEGQPPASAEQLGLPPAPGTTPVATSAAAPPPQAQDSAIRPRRRNADSGSGLRAGQRHRHAAAASPTAAALTRESRGSKGQKVEGSKESQSWKRRTGEIGTPPNRLPTCSVPRVLRSRRSPAHAVQGHRRSPPQPASPVPRRCLRRAAAESALCRPGRDRKAAGGCRAGAGIELSVAGPRRGHQRWIAGIDHVSD